MRHSAPILLERYRYRYADCLCETILLVLLCSRSPDDNSWCHAFVSFKDRERMMTTDWPSHADVL
jgi:hypothetical protein